MARVAEIARAVKSVALYHKRDLKNAEDLLRGADTSNPDTWIYMGNLKFESGAFEEAIRCYDKALEISPNNVAALYNKANALLQTGRNEEALQIFEQLANQNPDIEEIWNNLGNVYARKGNIEEAIESYTRALQINPDYALARYNLGMVLAQKGEYEQAREQFSKVIEQEEMSEAYCAKASCEYATQNFQEALETINKAIALNSKNLDAWLLRAAILAELEKTEDALATLKECMEISKSPEVFLASAKLCLRSQRLKEAEELLKECVEKDAENPAAWELLADVEFQLQRYDGAIYAAERAMAIEESIEHRWYLEYLLGSAYFEKKEFGEARQHLENSISEKADFAEGYVRLGFTMLELGKREEGLELLAKASEMAPDNWKILYLLAKGKFEMGEVEEAENLLARALAINQDSDILLLRGRILMLKGDREGAIQMFEKAVDINPANFEGWYAKGKAFYEANELDKAIGSLQIAIKINPWHYNSLYYLALAFERQGQYENAIATYEEILKFSPKDFQTLYNLGRIYTRIERWSDAYRALKKAFELRQEYPCALMLGLAAGKNGKSEEAVDYLEKATELDPYAHEAYFELGKLYLEREDFAKAIEKLEMAIKLGENKEYLKYLGIAHYRSGNAEKALAIFEGLSDEEAKVYAAECAIALGQEEKALSFLQSLEQAPFDVWLLRGKCEERLGKLEEALHSYSKAIEMKPDAIEGWFRKGNVLISLGRQSEALECYQQILAKEESEEVLLKVTEIYLSLGEFRKVIEIVERLRSKGKGEEKTLLWLEGLAYFSLEEFGKAREKFEKLLAIEEKIEALTKLAFACGKLKDWQAAISYLERYVEARAEDVDAWKMLSEFYYASGDVEKCLNALDKCIEINPEVYEPWYNKGTMLLTLKRFDEAINVLAKASEIQPNEAKIWNNLGSAYMGLSLYEKALKAFESAIACELENAEAWYNKGLAFLRMGKRREAIECFDKASSIKPEYLDVLFIKGCAYAELNEHEKAIECLSEFLEKKPEHFEALMMRGKSLLAMERWREAKEDFAKAIALEPANFEPYKLAAIASAHLLAWEDVDAYASHSLERKAEDAEGWALKALASLNSGKQKNAIKFCQYAEEIDKTMLDCYYLEAIASILSHEPSQAIESLERALLANPTSPKANFLLGSAHAVFGQREKAIKLFENAISIEKNEKITYHMARFLYKIERFEEAIALLEGLSQRNFLHNFLLGLCYNATGNYPNALQCFHLSARQNFLPAKLMLAQVHYSLENYREALAAIEGIESLEAWKLRGWIYAKLSIWEKAISELEKVAKTPEMDGESAYSLALALFSLNRIVEAKEYLEIAKGSMPPSAPQWLLLGRVKILEAEIAKDENLRAEGIECFRKALALKQGSSQIIYELARNLFLLGRYEEAAEYAPALAKSTAIAELLLAGKIYEKIGKAEEALKCYLSCQKENLEVFEGCTRCYFKLGNYKKVIEYGKRALEIDGKSPALLPLAVAKLVMNESDAKEIAERALENGYVSEDLLIGYAKLLLDQNEPEKVIEIFSENEERISLPIAGALWARALLARKEYEKALSIVERFLAIKEASELLFVRGEILEAMQMLGEALASFERAHAQQPDNIEISIKLGKIYYRTGKVERAREIAKQILSVDRNSGDGWYLLGVCSEGKERLECLSNAVRLKESDEACTAYAKALFDQGEFARAEDFLNRCLQKPTPEILLLSAKVKLKLGKLEEAERLLERIARTPESQEVYVEILMKKGDFGRAVKEYENLLAKEKKFEYLVGMARALKEIGNYERASEFYAEALDLRPAAEEIWEELAQIQISRKMFEKLKKTLENYIRLKPEEYAPYYNLGILLLADGDLKGAENALRKSIALAKENEKAWNALGNVYMQKGDVEMAKEYFEKAVGLNPDYWRGWYNLALVYSKKRDFSQALAMVSNAEKILGDNLDVGLLKATLLLTLKKVKEGEKLLERLYAKHPENERVIFNYGIALMLSGKLDAALAMFEKAIERKRDYVEAWLNAGIIYYQKGEHRKAGIAFETVLGYDRDNRIARKYLGEIEKIAKK